MSNDPHPPDFIRNEALGDFSGIKGNYYHFVYALYLLLRGEAQEIHFYAGNDLLNRPPVETEEGDGCGLRLPQTTHDDWVQLKNVSSETAWTPTALFSDETLLLNFVLNGLYSEHFGRTWTVKLVSPATVRGDALRDFLEDPQKFSDLNARFDAILGKAYSKWSEWLRSQEADASSLVAVRGMARSVVEQVAQSPIMPAEHLVDKIQIELLQVFPDSRTATKVAYALRGALMDAGSLEAVQPLPITVTWLEERSGYTLQPQDLLGIDVVRACDRQVERYLPPEWSLIHYASRPDLHAALTEFIASDRPLFVLSGDSGSGKSWASAYLASQLLIGKVRVRIGGSTLLARPSLTALLADALQSFARAEASAEEIKRLLIGAAADPARGPLVLVLDDLPLSQNVAAFGDALERLCLEARDLGAKIVLAVRQSIWQRLSTPRLLAPYLFRRTGSLQDPPPYSYALTRLSDAEMADVLERRLPVTFPVRRLALILRQPAFAALNNPYLLSIYIRHLVTDDPQNSGPLPSKRIIIRIDSLLDREIEQRFNEAGRRCGCDVGEMQDAQAALVAMLWQERRSGSRPGVILKRLEELIPGLGRGALRALQDEDVLTSAGDLRRHGSNITYSNPQFGDRLTAVWLARRLQQGENILDEMEPGSNDDGVMAALVRGAVDDAVEDPLGWSEEVLGRDGRWLYALSQGLAQRGQDDWRVLTMITAWSSRKEPYSTWNTMRSLGAMTAWSSRARTWVASMYADEEASQMFRGQVALGAALQVVPHWVQRRIRLRLRREIDRPASFMGDNKNRVRFIKGALQPLEQVAHAEAAAVAQALTRWLDAHYRPTRPLGHADVREQFDEVLDSIRGQVAVYGTQEGLDRILEGLASGDVEVRLRAARALLPVAHDRPEAARLALFEQARQERALLPYFLRPLIYYTESDPDDLLDIVQATGALQSLGCATALVLLARIARERPERVHAVLPEGLADGNADWNAVLSEMLSFCWWQYAAAAPQDAQAIHVLEALSSPDASNVTEKFRAFASHGAAIAVLGRIGLDVDGMSAVAREENIAYHVLALEMGTDAFYSDYQKVVLSFAAQIANHPLFRELISRLAETVRLFKQHEIHPVEQPHCEWQYRVAVVSSDFLAALAVHMEDTQALVESLPRDWPALRVCNALLDANTISNQLIGYGCGICAGHANVVGNVSADRDRFLYHLRAAGRLPEAFRSLANGPNFTAESGITRLAVEVSQHPAALLDALHAHVDRGNAIPFLWKWSCESPDWRAVQLGHAFRAAFSEKPFSRSACQLLCELVLGAVHDLPASPLKEQCRSVYSALQDFVSGKDGAIPEITAGPDLIAESHGRAMQVLRDCQREGPLDRAWFQRFIADTAGWVDDVYQWVEDGTVHSGVGKEPGVYFPPALRIALTVASLRAGQEDFVWRWRQDQHVINKALTSGACETVFRGYSQQLGAEEQQATLRSALATVDELLARFPQEAGLWQSRGHLLMLLHEADEARLALETCLSVPAHRKHIHGSAHYNLACALTRLGDVAGAERELRASIPDVPLLTQRAVKDDPDFALLQGEAWFIALVAGLSQGPIGYVPPAPDAEPES